MKGIIFTVNYKNYQDTIKFVSSIQILNGSKNIDIIIIDNSGFNENREDLYNKSKLEDYLNNSLSKNVHLIVSKKNLGYFGAVSFAIKEKNLKLEDYDFTIISNNDILISDIDFFEKLYLCLDEGDVIAPSITSLKTGEEQNPYRENKLSQCGKLYYRIYFLHFILALLLLTVSSGLRKKSNKKTRNNIIKREIYSGHGSFVIFTSSFFKNNGYIDSRLFLYGEEEFISAIVHSNNMTIRYFPDLKVLHDEHKSTNANAFSKKTYEYQKSAYFLIKNNFPGIY